MSEAGHGFFGELDNIVHHQDRFVREAARGRFGRQHYEVGAVDDGVGHVGDLGPRRPARDGHVLEHLGGGDDELLCGVAFFDYLLLDYRDLVNRDGDAHIAACYHYPVGGLDDFIDVVYRLPALDFRYDFTGGQFRFYKCGRFEHVLFVADKRQGDVVDFVLDAELDVLSVLFGNAFELELGFGDIDSFSFLEQAAFDDLGLDTGLGDVFDAECEVAVVDVNHLFGFELVQVAGIVEGDCLRAVGLRVVAEPDGRVVVELPGFGAFEPADADAESFEVLHDADAAAVFGVELSDKLDHVQVLFVVSVREVEPCDVQAGRVHLAKHGIAAAGRAKGRYNLCFRCHYVSFN